MLNQWARVQESHPLTRLVTKMSKKWLWTSKMYDSCLCKGQAGIQVFCVSSWGSKLTAGSQTCEWQNMCSSCETHVIYFGMWSTLWKKKPAFRYQTSLNLFMWKFLWIYGELFFYLPALQLCSVFFRHLNISALPC